MLPVPLICLLALLFIPGVYLGANSPEFQHLFTSTLDAARRVVPSLPPAIDEYELLARQYLHGLMERAGDTLAFSFSSLHLFTPPLPPPTRAGTFDFDFFLVIFPWVMAGSALPIFLGLVCVYGWPLLCNWWSAGSPAPLAPVQPPPTPAHVQPPRRVDAAAQTTAVAQRDAPLAESSAAALPRNSYGEAWTAVQDLVAGWAALTRVERTGIVHRLLLWALPAARSTFPLDAGGRLLRPVEAVWFQHDPHAAERATDSFFALLHVWQDLVPDHQARVLRLLHQGALEWVLVDDQESSHSSTFAGDASEDEEESSSAESSYWSTVSEVSEEEDEHWGAVGRGSSDVEQGEVDSGTLSSTAIVSHEEEEDDCSRQEPTAPTIPERPHLPTIWEEEEDEPVIPAQANEEHDTAFASIQTTPVPRSGVLPAPESLIDGHNELGHLRACLRPVPVGEGRSSQLQEGGPTVRAFRLASSSGREAYGHTALPSELLAAFKVTEGADHQEQRAPLQQRNGVSAIPVWQRKGRVVGRGGENALPE
ncbi:hypothetical protein FB45DRAFT_955192 [Roridomyces roridus]|uniref:Uncharacterized protein n=1 Tax=Roridomyces roridus TaxID=1738132 RepID=A0AAD7AZC6_9AGAR|nr:hypothetical protein FB45DRAFT_955192 [Roridomyces roridus]